MIYSVNNFFIFHFSQWTCYCLKPWMDWFDFRISEKNIFKSVIQYHTTRTRDLLNNLTLSRRRPLSYRNQSIDLLRKSMDWFLYDNGLRLERVKGLICLFWFYEIKIINGHKHWKKVWSSCIKWCICCTAFDFTTRSCSGSTPVSKFSRSTSALTKNHRKIAFTKNYRTIALIFFSLPFH